MCGRAYQTYTEEELAARYHWLEINRNPLGLKNNYNLSPTQSSPIVYFDEKGVQIKVMRWGLVPFWAKDLASASKYSLINAKSEEIETKKSYQNAFLKRRGIMPVSGFYEWQRQENKKIPFAIFPATGEIMSFATVYETWISKETGEVIDSFSILTTEANAAMRPIHHRMPVILNQMNEQMWLSNETPFEKIRLLTKPCPDSWLKLYQVSTQVNSSRNNSAELIKPVSS